MNADTILQSLMRGRLLAATAAGTIAVTSATAGLTGTISEFTAILNALLSAVSVIAAISSKLREIRGKE